MSDGYCDISVDDVLNRNFDRLDSDSWCKMSNRLRNNRMFDFCGRYGSRFLSISQLSINIFGFGGHSGKYVGIFSWARFNDFETDSFDSFWPRGTCIFIQYSCFGVKFGI